MKSDAKHIVILGSGFAGARAYNILRSCLTPQDNVRVTIVSERDYFWFVPMAHEVATGNLSPGSVKYSLRNLPQNAQFDFLQARVESVDFDEQSVSVACVNKNDDRDTLSYDYLVVALGSTTCFFNVDGAKAHTIPLKTLDDVRAIKNTILKRFEEAQGMKNVQERHDTLQFAVVGGGPTGVEVAGEIGDLLQGSMRRSYPSLASEAGVVLLQRSHALISEDEQWFSRRAEEVLKKLNIRVRFGSEVSRVDEKGVWCGKDFVPARTVIWTAGVQAQEFGIHAKKEITIHERSRRIRVRKDLSLSEYRSVYVAGDIAWVDEKETGQPYPMRAQFAVRQGERAAENIIADIRGKERSEFHWKDKGFIVSIGHGQAIARLLGVRFTGPLAWFMYRTAYLPQIMGWRARLRVMFEWTINLFLPRDLTEI